jgi:hypothetical protein
MINQQEQTFGVLLLSHIHLIALRSLCELLLDLELSSKEAAILHNMIRHYHRTYYRKYSYMPMQRYLSFIQLFNAKQARKAS